MDKKKFAKLTKKYVDADKKYKMIISEYIGSIWEHGVLTKPLKPINRKGLERINKAEYELDHSHSVWLDELRKK